MTGSMRSPSSITAAATWPPLRAPWSWRRNGGHRRQVRDRVHDVVAAADRIVLPGQGAFADCAQGLRAVAGMWEAIEPPPPPAPRSWAFASACNSWPSAGWSTPSPRLRLDQGDVAEMPVPGLRLPQMGWNGLDFDPGRIRCWRVYIPAIMPISCTVTPWWGQSARDDRDHRLWRARCRIRRRRQSRRHPVSR